jgi:AraC family transcriptional regulator
VRDISILVTALNVIEENLCEQFTLDDLAKECYVSVSGLQKLFSYAFRCSIGEYLSKRQDALILQFLIDERASF